MRRVHIGWMTMILVLVASRAGWAGVYNTMEKPFDLGANFSQFRKNTLIPLRQLGNPDIGTPLNLRCLFVDDMLSMTGRPNWSSESRLNLSAYLIRIGHQENERYTKAIGLLRNIVNVERDNFLAYANLGTATQFDGDLRQAMEHLGIALELWPENWNDLSSEKQKWLRKRGWDQTSFAWYRTVEEHHHKLVKLRMFEAFLKKIEPGQLPPAPDELFGPVRFVADEKGNFIPGKIADAEKKKIPPEAIPIVKQLLIWMPLDDRLYWLLGELYNAEGDVAAAKQIVQELHKKWQSLGIVGKGEFRRPPEMPKLFLEHYDALDKAIVDTGTKSADDKQTIEDKTLPKQFDWNSMLIGIVVGVMIAFFAFWQLRVMGRRRRNR